MACGTRDMGCGKANKFKGTEPWVACMPASPGSIKPIR